MPRINKSLISKDIKCSCRGSNLDKLLQPQILTLLAKKSLHGYSIIQEFENKNLFNGEKADNTGIYRALKTLEDKGMVNFEWELDSAGPAKKIYSITDKGIECLANWIETLENYTKTIHTIVDEAKDIVKNRVTCDLKGKGHQTKMVRIILVGGFLGAGKTTLLWESARKISENGKRVGLITNDQASELVDTAFLERTNGTVLEVSGSCFCCNFNGLINAISHGVSDKQCEIIIAEPVGSCTDLSATILQPLKEKFRNAYALAPLTVLADPGKLTDILNGGTAGLHESAAYIFKKQLEEADIILINKTDLITPAELESLKLRTEKEWPLAQVSSISAKTGEGLTEWIYAVMNSADSGTHLAEVDYDTYAEGEAVLGWLNASFQLRGKEEDWDAFLSRLIQLLGLRFEHSNSSVGHVKVLIESNGNYAIGNLIGKSETIKIRGNAGRGDEAKLTINARVQMSPSELETAIFEELKTSCGEEIQCETLVSNCLSPGRPDPTYRFDHTV